MSLEQRDLTFDETALIRKIQGGDSSLFSELVSRYQDRLYNLAYRLTGSPDEASDLAQETFVKAIKGIGQFHEKSRFYTWLVRILINTTTDWRTKSKQDHQAIGQMQEMLKHSQAGGLIGDQDPQQHLEHAELVERLWQAMDLLDEEHRQILLLREQEHLSYQEMAQILKVSEGTIKSRLFRAREALRKHMMPMLNLNSGDER